MTQQWPGPAGVSPSPRRAMTVDVEEYYHAWALAAAFPRSNWNMLESRVERSTLDILAVFARQNVKATFFTLGSVARAHPKLLREIASAGHELASHGDQHFRVGEQSPEEFRADIRISKAAIEDASGTPVHGYRAASFSINPATWWAYKELEKSGYMYSSSVYPIRHDHYGLVDSPSSPFQPLAKRFVEIPVTTTQVSSKRLPAGGGGYFRLMPYRCFSWLHRRATAQPQRRANFYFHPWEIDPDQPHASTNLRSRFRHYVNLSGMKAKVERLTTEFAWGTMRDVYAADLDAAANLPRWSPEPQKMAD